MEHDAKSKVKHEKRVKVKEKDDPVHPKKLQDEFLECQPREDLSEEEKKKVINSVKLTKALVLLGYSCWSDLEPGNKLIYSKIQH